MRKASSLANAVSKYRYLTSRRLSNASDLSHLRRYEGKLNVLRVECTKCARKGRYQVRKLIEKYGCKGNLMKWKEQLNGDCPRRDSRLPRPLRLGVS